MVAREWSLMRFLIKGSVAGEAVYLVYDQELLGPSDKNEAVLQKAEEIVLPAMHQFHQYVYWQMRLEIPQIPVPPKINFPNFHDPWSSGIISAMAALSVAPSKAREENTGNMSKNTASNGYHLPQHCGGQDQDAIDIPVRTSL